MAETERFLSSNWYRVAALKPRLREHAVVRMHRYRGQPWYVISDGVQNRVHRVSPAAYVLVAAMDGTRSLDNIWSDAAVTLGEHAPTQDQAIQLLGQLYRNDLVAGDVPPDAGELFERRGRLQRGKVLQWLLNPLALRIPLVDPNAFLGSTLWLVRPLVGPLGAVLWLAAVLPALLLAAQHWPELTQNISDRVLPPQNLLLIGAIYPVIKLLHELGHGYTTRAHGGEVHELGIMLLVLLPLPYIEVSAAAGFRSKWTRCLVGASGMMVEIFIAALAMYVWLAVEPGVLRAVAFNVMLTASISSVLFNGNPLLRYDGYYVLADAVEVPNLAQRGGQYWSYLTRRYLFGTPQNDFAATSGERVWFLLYTPLAMGYRVAVTVGIALFLMKRYLAAGIALALWGAATGIALPVLRAVWSILTSNAYLRRRGRAVAVTGGLIVAGAALLLWVPAPLHVEVEGVVWLPDDAFVRAGTAGFVQTLRATPGMRVRRGDVLLVNADPELQSNLVRLRAREDELAARLDSVRFSDRVEAILTKTELDQVRIELAREEQRAALLRVRADRDGIFVMPDPDDAIGRFAQRGQLLAYVVPPAGARTVRATVSQEDVQLVRRGVRQVRIKLDDLPARTIAVQGMREVPAGTDRLPSAALGTTGGGQTLVDPRDEKGMRSLNRVFQIDLELARAVPRAGFGERAYVRFDLPWEPLGVQLWRRTRQVLLSRVAI